MQEEPLIFALGASQAFGIEVAVELGLALAPHEERRFEDGENKLRPLIGVRGRDVYVLHALYGGHGQSVHDKFCELLFFIGALKDAGAARVTAALPYLCYARKDRRTKPRDPVTTRYVAQLLEAVGVDCVVALEVHNRQAFDNAFRRRTEHIEARVQLAEALLKVTGDVALTVVSPDPGGAKRAELFRQVLVDRLSHDPPLAFVEKHRSGGVVSGGAVIGDVTGRPVIIIDDLISTGTTLLRAAEACRAQGATAVYAAATHALFAPGAEALFTAPALDRLYVSNSVPVDLPDSAHLKVEVVPVESVFARAIAALHAHAESPVLET